MSTIYAEVRIEGADRGGPRHYTKRFLVWDESGVLGTYGVHFAPDGPYGASRDYHMLATEDDIKKRKIYQDWLDNDIEDDAMPTPAQSIYSCCYFDNKPCICDGSSLVEVTLDEKRSFEIAHMMSER